MKSNHWRYSAAFLQFSSIIQVRPWQQRISWWLVRESCIRDFALEFFKIVYNSSLIFLSNLSRVTISFDSVAPNDKKVCTSSSERGLQEQASLMKSNVSPNRESRRQRSIWDLPDAQTLWMTRMKQTGGHAMIFHGCANQIFSKKKIIDSVLISKRSGQSTRILIDAAFHFEVGVFNAAILPAGM